MNSDIHEEIIAFCQLPEKLKYYSLKPRITIEEIKILVGNYNLLRKEWEEYIENLGSSMSLITILDISTVDDYDVNFNNVHDFKLLCFSIKTQLDIFINQFSFLSFSCCYVYKRDFRVCNSRSYVFDVNGPTCKKHSPKNILDKTSFLRANLSCFNSLYDTVNIINK